MSILLPAEVEAIPALRQLIPAAHHVDVKVYEGDLSLNEFIAGFLNFYPGWMKTLYRIRWAFVRLLGMTQRGIPSTPGLRPDAIPMGRGEKAAFFTVEAAEAERYWLVCADEPHLAAYLGIVAQPLGGTRQRFSVVTVVHYHQWTGAVYFNVIRPFHHFVVNHMAQGALARA